MQNIFGPMGSRRSWMKGSGCNSCHLHLPSLLRKSMWLLDQSVDKLFQSVGKIKVIDSKKNIYNFTQIYIDEKKRERALKVYPFSGFATDAMIALLLETNRLNQIDENIYDINRGLMFEGSEEKDLPYKEKVSYLNIQDICIRPMTETNIDDWKGKSTF